MRDRGTTVAAVLLEMPTSAKQEKWGRIVQQTKWGSKMKTKREKRLSSLVLVFSTFGM